MIKYYRIRATSMATFYGYVKSDDLPHIFNKAGDFKGDYTIYDEATGVVPTTRLKGFPHSSVPSTTREGRVTNLKVQDPDFDLYDQSFPYGIKPVHEDFEFTDYNQVSEEEYNDGCAERARIQT